MAHHRRLVGATFLFLLTSCGYFSEDPKISQEQQWLAKDQQLADAIGQIRDKGLDAVIQSAEAGSVAACVAGRLAGDPMGRLVSVEGALMESAKVANLLADIEKLLAQDFSFDQLGGLLEQGAAAAAYAANLLSQQELPQALESLKQMAAASKAFAGQDLGAHLQALIATCQQYDVKEPAPETNKT